MVISRNQVLKRREKLEKEKNKHAEKLKALDEKMKEMKRDVQKAEKAQNEQRAKIIGNVLLKKFKNKESYQGWLEKDIFPFIKENEKKIFNNGGNENV